MITKTYLSLTIVVVVTELDRSIVQRFDYPICHDVVCGLGDTFADTRQVLSGRRYLALVVDVQQMRLEDALLDHQRLTMMEIECLLFVVGRVLI